MDKYGSIELTGMEFHAYHGRLWEERQNGNTFIVDFVGKIEIKKAARTDDIADTVDYSLIYKIVEKEMKKPSFLLEAVAGRIVEAIKDANLGLYFFKVKVSKKNPPVGGTCAWSSVTATHGAWLIKDTIL
ncbi:MAG: dihydroneopterin aldolase [Bacteroidales bacterium]|nr:dihydroneopterin aldolase [Bacteroidales bacterium]